jgi:predicted acetyltransferase
MSAPTLVPLPESDKSVLWSDLQDYIRELAQFDRSVPPQGLYAYPGFDMLWCEPGRWLFWAKLDGEIAGFAIVHSADGVTDMTDFYIRPAYRRRGVGLEFARLVVARFSGSWTLSQFKAKTDSIAFWRSVIGMRSFAEHEYTSVNGNARVRQSFVS